MDKREQIERALMRFFVGYEGWWVQNLFGMLIRNGGFFDALIKQAIVIECEVEQGTCCKKECGWDTFLTIPNHSFHGDYNREFGIRGKHGTPGKALAIIIPLENNEDSQQS